MFCSHSSPLHEPLAVSILDCHYLLVNPSLIVAVITDKDCPSEDVCGIPVASPLSALSQHTHPARYGVHASLCADQSKGSMSPLEMLQQADLSFFRSTGLFLFPIDLIAHWHFMIL